jgi:hypothetical protein
MLCAYNASRVAAMLLRVIESLPSVAWNPSRVTQYASPVLGTENRFLGKSSPSVRYVLWSLVGSRSERLNLSDVLKTSATLKVKQ